MMTAKCPHAVTRDFEDALCEYAGSPYAVAVNSCTMALLLCCSYLQVEEVTIPRRTYVSVPMSILHSGGRVAFDDREWRGAYQLKPYPIYDCARRFTARMFRTTAPGIRATKFLCVSFHASKILGIEQGGAILHGSGHADAWLRRARFDGRGEGVRPKDDNFRQIGWHCYMNPSTAAQGLLKLSALGADNQDLPNDDYPDLSKFKIFQRKGTE